MILSKADLHNYIHADFVRQEMSHPLMARFTFGEHNRTRKYLYILRHLEYYKNKKKSALGYVLLAIWMLRYRHYSLKTDMYILPNTCGKGLLLPHPGFIRVGSLVNMGENCTILPMVLFGKKKPTSQGKIIVGHNCYFGVGSTILGPVTIGNNAIIGAGSVVTKDIPSYAVVAGNPAKVIKIIKEDGENNPELEAH